MKALQLAPGTVIWKQTKLHTSLKVQIHSWEDLLLQSTSSPLRPQRAQGVQFTVWFCEAANTRWSHRLEHMSHIHSLWKPSGVNQSTGWLAYPSHTKGWGELGICSGRITVPDSSSKNVKIPGHPSPSQMPWDQHRWWHQDLTSRVRAMAFWALGWGRSWGEDAQILTQIHQGLHHSVQASSQLPMWRSEKIQMGRPVEKGTGRRLIGKVNLCFRFDKKKIKITKGTKWVIF